MTLSDLTLPISYEDARQYALVFDASLSQRLKEIHEKHGSQKCVPTPRTLIDGRLMLCADILTEIVPGGLLYDMWQAADLSILLPSVEVIAWEEAISLLPPNENTEGTNYE